MERRLCYLRRADDGQNGPELGATPEADDAVGAPRQLAAKRAMHVLKGANDKVSVDLVGETVLNPKLAHENFVEALKLVRQHFSKHLKIDLDDLTFQKLAGDQIGESTDTQTIVDPKIFRHPVRIIAAGIAHEWGHQKNTIQNEGLVQAWIESVLGKMGFEHGYEGLVDNFNIFAAKFDKNGDAKRGIATIYKLYKEEKFEKIYTTYSRNHIKKLKTPEERAEARKFFQAVFPELEFDGRDPGFFTMKELAKGQDTL